MSSLNVLVTHTVTPQLDIGPTDHFKRVSGLDADHEVNSTFSTHHNVYSSELNGPVLEMTQFHPHPMVMCCSKAYNEHYPLVLSPDDIWLLIAQGVAQHIGANSEQLKHLFISNKDEAEMKEEGKGKIDIVVRLDPYVDVTKEASTELGKVNWNGVVSEIVSKVDGFLQDDATQLLECNFTTSGSIEKTASRIVAMEAFKNFFSYYNMFKCGLPSTTLLGTLQDWISIKNKISQLDKYGLEFWTKALHPIMDRIIETAKTPSSTPLPEHLCHFWNSIAMYGRQSGGYHVTGWIAYFFPYCDDKVNHYLQNLKEGFLEKIRVGGFGIHASGFPPGLSKVPVQLINSPIPGVNSVDYLAGFVGYDYDETYQGMKPRIGWAIASPKTTSEMQDD